MDINAIMAIYTRTLNTWQYEHYEKKSQRYHNKKYTALANERAQ